MKCICIGPGARHPQCKVDHHAIAERSGRVEVHLMGMPALKKVLAEMETRLKAKVQESLESMAERERRGGVLLLVEVFPSEKHVQKTAERRTRAGRQALSFKDEVENRVGEALKHNYMFDDVKIEVV